MIYASRTIPGSATCRIGTANQDRKTDPGRAAAADGSAACDRSASSTSAAADGHRAHVAARGSERLHHEGACSQPAARRQGQDPARPGNDPAGAVPRQDRPGCRARQFQTPDQSHAAAQRHHAVRRSEQRCALLAAALPPARTRSWPLRQQYRAGRRRPLGDQPGAGGVSRRGGRRRRAHCAAIAAPARGLGLVSASEHNDRATVGSRRVADRCARAGGDPAVDACRAR